MKSAYDCEVCGKRLSNFRKSYVCSDKCRKRKSRLRLDAFKNAVDVRNGLRNLIKGLDLDVIDCSSIRDEYEPIFGLVENLVSAYNARLQREKD